MTELPSPAEARPAITWRIASVEQPFPPEMKGLQSWVHEQLKNLPEMKVTTSPVTDGKKWKATMTREGEVDTISSNFFSIKGVDVSTPALSWHQGAIIQRADALPTADGKSEPVSGFVILMTDPDNRTFVVMHQEPLIQPKFRDAHGALTANRSDKTSEIHPVVRTPLQTSVEKMQKLIKDPINNKKYDPNLAVIFGILTTTRSMPVENTLSQLSFAKVPPDADRMKSDVVYGNIRVTNAEKHAIQDAIPAGRWCTPEELDVLATRGLLNGHMHEARSIVGSQQRLSQPRATR